MRREPVQASLRPLEVIARRFERESRADAAGHAAFVRAATAAQRRRVDAASRHWGRATQHYEKAGMRLHAACAMYRRAELVSAGAQRDAALSAVRSCGVQEPERWLRMFMPSGLGS